jgi:hypothetical protein
VRALRVYTVGALATLAISCLAVPAPALGLEPGVHADPGSPAAKQYSLPLNQARQTGAGPAGHEGSSANVPFGAGIKPPGTGGSSHSGAGTVQATGRSGASRPNATNTAGRQATLPSAVLRASSSRAGGDDSTLALLGGAVAILILGGFGGILMRRSRGSLSSS